MTIAVELVLLLMLRESWREPFVDKPHMHIEVTVLPNQPPTLIASGDRIDGRATPAGLRLTASVGTPVASVLRESL